MSIPTRGSLPGEVVPLQDEVPEALRPPPPSGPRSRLHAFAIYGLALFATTSIVCLIAFLTVRWPDRTGRYVVAALIASLVATAACASAAILAAARDTYARAPTRRELED
jgi:hypothetical protein